MIDRPQIKQSAREAMKNAMPGVLLVSLLFFVINELLALLSNRIQYGGMSADEMLEMLMQGIEPVSDPGFLGFLLLLALSVMRTLVAVGYDYYCLRLGRGLRSGVGDMFDVFGIFFKIVWLNILMGIFIFLWSLLLVVPGIIAVYRYSMAFYILLDDPDKGALQCINESKEMMMGYKWELFVLELSFLGWALLACIPVLLAGLSIVLSIILIAATFVFLMPYVRISRAGFYNTVSGWHPEAEPIEGEYKEPWEQ